MQRDRYKAVKKEGPGQINERDGQMILKLENQKALSSPTFKSDSTYTQKH